jgi:polysaccharide deacetylase family protein (PEP-CTERM system associated)
MSSTAKICDGAFTVDVEDYFHVSAFASRINPADWDQYECRVEQNTHRVLNIAARSGTTGTFFVLGWVAERYPHLVRDIQEAGHEIGCHSMWHQLVFDLGPDRFRRDLIDARNVLEDVTGRQVVLYRAPSFSVTKRSLWAVPVLREEGFHTDSSIYPVRHDRYGIPNAPLAPHVIDTAAGPVREFPGMVCEVGNMRIPVGGGGYLRLFPWALTQRLLHRVRRQARPLNVYIHPWEFDPQQPRVAASLKSRFRHYQNLKATTEKIERLLNEFSLSTMSAVLDQWPFPKGGGALHANTSSVSGGV